MRLFVAVTPGPDVLARISAGVHGLRGQAPSAKWVGPEGMHLTLAFLGERDPGDAPKLGEALAAAAASHAPFVLRWRGGGAFGRPGRPRVLWVGCEGDTGALRALHQSVVSALGPLGYVPDRPGFEAHLTLCRAREQGGDRRLVQCVDALRDQDFGESRVEEIELYESRLSPAGARYTAVSRAPLGGL